MIADGNLFITEEVLGKNKVLYEREPVPATPTECPDRQLAVCPANVKPKKPSTPPKEFSSSSHGRFSRSKFGSRAGSHARDSTGTRDTRYTPRLMGSRAGSRVLLFDPRSIAHAPPNSTAHSRIELRPAPARPFAGRPMPSSITLSAKSSSSASDTRHNPSGTGNSRSLQHSARCRSTG